jgi:hypothetical protein
MNEPIDSKWLVSVELSRMPDADGRTKPNNYLMTITELYRGLMRAEHIVKDE